MKANERQVGGQHYGPGKSFMHWDWAVANNLPYLEGVLTKYVCRWKTSGKPDDRAKALHYAEKLREVQAPGGRNTSWERPKEIKLLPELVAAYKLTFVEAEICMLAARYAGTKDLERLRALIATL